MQTDITISEAATSPVVVLGRDDKGKPHASRFEAADALLAEKAAGLMGMQVLRIASDEQAALAATLPLGRIYAASGKGFVPFVKAELFAKLAAADGVFTPPPPPAEPASAPDKLKGGRLADAGGEGAADGSEAADGPGTPPPDQAGITLGSLVLAAEESNKAIFYCATVVAHRGDDLFELQWYEGGNDLPLIVRRREHLGLFPPALVGTLA